MSRYIDADKAIEAVRGAFEFEVETPDNYKDIAVETLKLLTAVDVAPQWIPVTERLPEEEGTYLVTYTDGGVTEVGSSIYLQREDGSEPYWDYFVVTAWMPLPEPYKGSEQNE